ncbi:hypothetical protein BJY01DRAFT_254753 [Aspergillus pseudoustus]|uniref:Zn(2)-C6 fungal-type domain-containing protein n=1 Tax=Aspergillus pseudoustus TaxID=1810923 RepID=A0ABR4IQV8_9EURO
MPKQSKEVDKKRIRKDLSKKPVYKTADGTVVQPRPEKKKETTGEAEQRRAEQRAERQPLEPEEVSAFQGAMNSYQGTLEEMGALDGEANGYDSDGTPRVTPRKRQTMGQYGPAFGLTRDVLVSHEEAVQERTGEIIGDRSRVLKRQELHYPSIMSALPTPHANDQKKAEASLPVCDRCKTMGYNCDRSGWACMKCIVVGVDCTWTHRTNKWTFHLARREDTVNQIGEVKLNETVGYHRRDMRRSTKLMTAGRDTLRDLQARCRALQATIDAQEDPGLGDADQLRVQEGRNAAAAVQQQLAEKDQIITNLNMQLAARYSLAQCEQIRALTIENSRLNDEIQRLKGNLESTPRSRKGPSERRARKERTRAAAAAASKTVAPSTDQQTLYDRPTYPDPQQNVPRQNVPEMYEGYAPGGYAPPGGSLPEYPAVPGASSSPELMTMKDMNLLQQAAYGPDEPDESPEETEDYTAEQRRGRRQQASDPYQSIDPELLRLSATDPSLAHQIRGQIFDQAAAERGRARSAERKAKLQRMRDSVMRRRNKTQDGDDEMDTD